MGRTALIIALASCIFIANIWKEATHHSGSRVLIHAAATTVASGTPGVDYGVAYPWKEREKYYYTDLRTKMEVLFTLGDCLNYAKQIMNSSMELPVDHLSALQRVGTPTSGGNSPQLLISSFPVAKDIYDWWRSMPVPKLMRVDPYICDVVYTKRLPIFNNTGCQLPTYMSPSAPRCQTKYLKWVCDNARMAIDDANTTHVFVLPEADHRTAETPPQPYLITANNALVSACGQLSLPCGLVHTNANCKATGYTVQAKLFRTRCPLASLMDAALTNIHGVTGGSSGSSSGSSSSIVNAGSSGSIRSGGSDNSTITQCLPGAPFVQYIHHYDRVFVVAEVDDTYIYHTHLEIMPRLVYHLEFLKANPDVKILFGCDAKKNKRMTEAGLKQGLQAIAPMMRLVGLSMDRLVLHQHVFAREVFLPMEGGCQDPVYNTWHVLTMRQLFLQKLGLLTVSPVVSEDSTQKHTWRSSSSNSINSGSIRASSAGSSSFSSSVGATNRKPVMLLLKRSSTSKHTRNGWDLVRQWNEPFTQELLLKLQYSFPEFNVVLFSDKNETLMRCYECQIREFASAKVLIGVHGAGLGNMLYMEPNGAVVELAPYGNDGRCLLGGGPFSRLAAVMAHNYMMHQPPYEEFLWNAADKSSRFDADRFVLHVRSFLISISFV